MHIIVHQEYNILLFTSKGITEKLYTAGYIGAAMQLGLGQTSGWHIHANKQGISYAELES